jgi:hypothetical protein
MKEVIPSKRASFVRQVPENIRISNQDLMLSKLNEPRNKMKGVRKRSQMMSQQNPQVIILRGQLSKSLVSHEFTFQDLPLKWQE